MKKMFAFFIIIICSTRQSFGQNAHTNVHLNKPLVLKLDSIYKEDQKYRKQIYEIGKKYGWDSKETEAQWEIINKQDSINLIEIKTILDKYGWLGADIIGEQGNST